MALALFWGLLALHAGVLMAVVRLWRTASQRRDPGGPVGGLSHWRWALAALTLVALALRVIHLNSCLWYDEVLTLLDFARLPAGKIFTSFPNQNQHMLYSLMAHGLFRVFGESAWALRLPAVFFGVASIWALFFLGRRLLGAAEALAACALMTFSYHHVWFSQNARGYTGLLFSATLATCLWLEALERREWRWWIGYSLALFAGFWIHMTIAFVALAHALLWAVMRTRPRWGVTPGHTVNRETEAGWRPLAAWALAGSLTLQVYALALPEFFRSAIHEVSLPSEWLNPLWVVREFVLGFSKAWFGPLAVAAAVAFVAAGYFSIFRKDWRAAVLMVLPAALGGAAMIGLAHNLWPRFFFFSMGFGVLVAVEGAMVCGRVLFAARGGQPGRLPYKAGLALASLLVVASAATLPRAYSLPKQDFAGARDYVESRRRPGEPVAAVGLAGRAYREYFAPRWSAPQTQAELEAMRRGAPGMWLVYTLPIEVRAYHPEIWRAIQSDFSVVRVFPGTLNGGEVYVCRGAASGQVVGLSHQAGAETAAGQIRGLSYQAAEARGAR